MACYIIVYYLENVHHLSPSSNIYNNGHTMFILCIHYQQNHAQHVMVKHSNRAKKHVVSACEAHNMHVVMKSTISTSLLECSDGRPSPNTTCTVRCIAVGCCLKIPHLFIVVSVLPINLRKGKIQIAA
jgi:hypothetical protein